MLVLLKLAIVAAVLVMVVLIIWAPHWECNTAREEVVLDAAAVGPGLEVALRRTLKGLKPDARLTLVDDGQDPERCMIIDRLIVTNPGITLRLTDTSWRKPA